MAYRRTYRELEAPWGGEIEFDLEFTDGEIFQAVEAILDKEEEAYQLKRKMQGHARTTPVMKELLAVIDKEHGGVSAILTEYLAGEIAEEHKDACARVKLLRDPLATNTKNVVRGPGWAPHFADMPNSPEYLQDLYKFSEGIKASGVSGEICPHPDRVMVRYYGPDDAKTAEAFLEKSGFKFEVESDG
jgi:hypothetical protein